jgi:carbon-monoxide dehydrogenase small subunit
MPGAALSESKGEGRYAGRVGVKLGPFNASFEGEAEVTADAAGYAGHVEGRGVDKRGGSRSKLALDYRLSEVGGATRVDIEADVQLSGPVAQFGRTGIIAETAGVLIEEFARNVEGRLAPAAAAPGPAVVANSNAVDRNEAPVTGTAAPIGVLHLLGRLVSAFFRRIFATRPVQR